MADPLDFVTQEELDGMSDDDLMLLAEAIEQVQAEQTTPAVGDPEGAEPTGVAVAKEIGQVLSSPTVKTVANVVPGLGSLAGSTGEALQTEGGRETIAGATELAAGVGGATAATLGTSLTGPASLFAGSAAGSASALAARKVMQRLGFAPPTTVEEDTIQTSVDFGLGVVAGPVLKALGGFATGLGRGFKRVANRITTTLDPDINLARALTDDPAEFNKFLKLHAVGSGRETLDEVVTLTDDVKHFLNSVPVDKRDKVFIELEKQLVGTKNSPGVIGKTNEVLDSLFNELKEELGDPEFSLKQIGFSDFVKQAEKNALAITTKAATEEAGEEATAKSIQKLLPDSQLRTVLNVLDKEKERFVKRALAGSKEFVEYQQATRTVRNLTAKRARLGLAGDELGDDELIKLENAQFIIDRANDLVDDLPFKLDDIKQLKRAFDSAAKLDKREGANFADRVRAEVNFDVANVFRTKLDDLIKGTGSTLASPIENTNSYLMKLLRIRPLLADRAATERAGTNEVIRRIS